MIFDVGNLVIPDSRAETLFCGILSNQDGGY